VHFFGFYYKNGKGTFLPDYTVSEPIRKGTSGLIFLMCIFFQLPSSEQISLFRTDYPEAVNNCFFISTSQLLFTMLVWPRITTLHVLHDAPCINRTSIPEIRDSQ